MKIDHHIHTSRHSPDSELHPKRLIAEAKAAGLDGIVITEHDYQWCAEELDELREAAGDLVVLSGVEVSAAEGHMLVYGLPDIYDIPIRVRVRDLARIVEERGGAMVAAHPYRWGQDFDRVLRDLGPCFAALETVSKNVEPDCRIKIESALKRYPTLGRTGSSDSHEPETVGCYFSEFAEPIRTIEEFVVAIKAGKSKPGHTPGKPLASGPVG